MFCIILMDDSRVSWFINGGIKLKVTRKKNKKRGMDGIIINPYKSKRLCKGWSNHGMLGRRY